MLTFPHKFHKDIVDECERDIRKLFEAGAKVSNAEVFFYLKDLMFCSEYPSISPKVV